MNFPKPKHRSTDKIRQTRDAGDARAHTQHNPNANPRAPFISDSTPVQSTMSTFQQNAGWHSTQPTPQPHNSPLSSGSSPPTGRYSFAQDTAQGPPGSFHPQSWSRSLTHPNLNANPNVKLAPDQLPSHIAGDGHFIDGSTPKGNYSTVRDDRFVMKKNYGASASTSKLPNQRSFTHPIPSAPPPMMAAQISDVDEVNLTGSRIALLTDDLPTQGDIAVVRRCKVVTISGGQCVVGSSYHASEFIKNTADVPMASGQEGEKFKEPASLC